MLHLDASVCLSPGLAWQSLSVNPGNIARRLHDGYMQAALAFVELRLNTGELWVCRPLLVVLFSQAAFTAGSLKAEIACHGSSVLTVLERHRSSHHGFAIERIEAFQRASRLFVCSCSSTVRGTAGCFTWLLPSRQTA